MNSNNRVCIYPKDIMRLTGKSERYSRDLLQKVCKKYAKEDHQFVTINEFCSYSGITIEQVIPFLES